MNKPFPSKHPVDPAGSGSSDYRRHPDIRLGAYLPADCFFHMYLHFPKP